jgi:hypothetical protein
MAGMRTHINANDNILSVPLLFRRIDSLEDWFDELLLNGHMSDRDNLIPERLDLILYGHHLVFHGTRIKASAWGSGVPGSSGLVVCNVQRQPTASYETKHLPVEILNMAQ